MWKVIRRVLGTIVVLVLLFVAWGWQRVGRIDVERVRDDLYVLTGIGGNVGVLLTPAGPVVVDTMTFVRQGNVILGRLHELTPLPVATILNTHYHQDHTHGNPAFTPGTRVVTTARTRAHLVERDADFWRDAPARELLPTETFDDTRELTIGGKTVRAIHLGRGHTDGDLVVLFVEDRVLHTGDLFVNGCYPNIDLEAGGSVREWAPTLNRILALDFDTVIPGHGPLGDRHALERFRDFMANLWEQTSPIGARGGSLDDALAAVDLTRFSLSRLWMIGPGRTFVITRAWEEASAGRNRH